MVLGIGGIGGTIPPQPSGRELIGLQGRKLAHDRLFHGVRAIERQLLHEALGHGAAHRSVGVPLDDDARRAELPGELADLLDDEADVRIVELLQFLALRVARDLLVQVPRVREEVDDDGLGEDLVLLALNRSRARRREVDVVLVLLARVLRLAAELLDDREIHHLVERRLLGDGVDFLVEEVRRAPRALEVGRAVLVEEEVAVLGVVGRVRVAQHAERIAFGDRVARGHQLRDLLLGGLRLQLLHRVEDPARDPFHDVRVVLREVGAREPDVRNQLVRRGRRHQDAVALHLLEVVDVGRPAHRAGEPLVRIERGGRLERVLRELEVDFRRLHAGVDERVQHEEVRRRVLREHERLAAQIGHRLDRVADDDAVAAVRPVDLLVDARHHARILAQPLEKERHHVERRPPDVQVAGGVRVAHRDRIVDQHELHLEVLAGGRLPRLAGTEAVVRVDDRAPARPHVDREADRAIGHRLVARDALHLGQPGGRDELVFLDGRDARCVGRFGAPFHLLQLVLRDLSRLQA